MGSSRYVIDPAEVNTRRDVGNMEMDERLGPGPDRKWIKLGFSKCSESEKTRKTFRHPKDAVRAWVLIGQP